MPKSIPAFDDFIPASSTKKAEGVWMISGIIISRYNNQKFESKSSIEARWQKEIGIFRNLRMKGNDADLDVRA